MEGITFTHKPAMVFTNPQEMGSIETDVLKSPFLRFIQKAFEKFIKHTPEEKRDRHSSHHFQRWCIATASACLIRPSTGLWTVHWLHKHHSTGFNLFMGKGTMRHLSFYSPVQWSKALHWLRVRCWAFLLTLVHRISSDAAGIRS